MRGDREGETFGGGWAGRVRSSWASRRNLTDSDPKTLWKKYMIQGEIEYAFRELKNDLGLRPVYHRLDERIETHIFAAFMALCLLATLRAIARARAPGLTPRQIIDKFKTLKMVDVILPTTDGRTTSLLAGGSWNVQRDVIGGADAMAGTWGNIRPHVGGNDLWHDGLRRAGTARPIRLCAWKNAWFSPDKSLVVETSHDSRTAGTLRGCPKRRRGFGGGIRRGSRGRSGSRRGRP